MFKKARYVLSVYKEGSFTKAAETLYISQPCLSAAIKQIETEIGARLFDRSTSSVCPTLIGLEYIKTAQQMIALEEDFALKVSAVHSLLAGKVRVGGSNYVCSYILPRVLDAFLQLYPHVIVELIEAHSSELAEMLAKGEIDIIVDSFDRDPEGCIYTPLLSEKILLAVPQSAKSNHKVKNFSTNPAELYLGNRSVDTLTKVSMEHFKNENFILLKPGNSMYKHAMRIFKESGVTPRVGLSLDQLSTSYFLCAQGGGCAFVTDTIFRYHKFDDSILLYNINESGSRTFGIAYKKDPYTSEIIKKIVKVAKDSIS